MEWDMIWSDRLLRCQLSDENASKLAKYWTHIVIYSDEISIVYSFAFANPVCRTLSMSAIAWYSLRSCSFGATTCTESFVLR